MTLDDDVLRWLYLQGRRGTKDSPDGDGFKSDSSVMSVLGNHRYLLMALFVVVVTFLLTITTLRNVRHRREKNKRPPIGKRHPLAAVLGRVQRRPSSTASTAAGTRDTTRSRFNFWRCLANRTQGQISARASKLTISKHSPQAVVSGQRITPTITANKHGFPSNMNAIVGNNSANKATKTSDCESHSHKATSAITFTNWKAPASQLEGKDARKVVPSLERTVKDREESLYTKDRNKTTSLIREVSECDSANGISAALTSKHQGGCDCRKRSTEDIGNGSNKLPVMAIDKFREINCFRAAEFKDNVPSWKHAGPTIKGHDYKTQSYSKAGAIHEMKTGDVASGRHVKQRFSEISIEDCMDDKKISLRDEQYIPTHRKPCKTRDEASHDRRYFQNPRNVNSDLVKSDSVMSANEEAVDARSENLRCVCRKYSNIQHDNNGTDSRMCASTQGLEPEGRAAYSELRGVKTNKKSSQWTSHRGEIAAHRARTPEARVRSRSPCTGSCSTSDDHLWSITRRNPVFEDQYSSFMKVSSLSRRGSSRLKRTIQLEPRPSKKLMVPKSKYEKLRFHSQQWPDEILYNKHKVPKLACLLLHPDDYLLEHGKQIGAQKVYTKDGFKFIVPLTFVSYGNKKKRVGPLTEERNDDLGFSLSNLSVDDVSDHKVDDVGSVDIRQIDELDDISNRRHFEGNVRKSGLRISTNTRRSSPGLSPVHVEDAEECGLVNCYASQELSRIVKKKLHGVRSYQDGAKHKRTRSGECGTSVLKMCNSSGQINETKPKEIARSSDVPVCEGCVNSENINTNDGTPKINEIIGKVGKCKTVEPRLKTGAGAESIKNVSKWLSDICSGRSHHSSCSSNTTVGLNRPEIPARKQSTRAHCCFHEDYVSSESGIWHHPLQEHENNPRINCLPVAHKYITPGILQSHLARKQLAMDAKNETGRKMDKCTSSQSNSSLSLTYSPIKHSITALMERRKTHFRANDKDDYRYNSDSLNDLENEKHCISRKHSMLNNKEVRHHMDDDDMKMDNNERFHKLIKKLTARGIQDCFPLRRFHRNKRSSTDLDSIEQVSVHDSVPVSYKSMGKLVSASPTFAHMPLFKNRHNESVNIIVRLESSAQKNLMEKHTYGSLMSAGVAARDSCLPSDADECCLVGKNQVMSETPVVDSAMRCLVGNSDVIFGNRDIPVKVFRQKQLRDITRMKQEFNATAEGNGPGQFRLHCAVLATDDYGLMSVKKFRGNIQEEDTLFIKGLGESRDQTKIIEDLTHLDLNSGPTSVHPLMKQSNAQGMLSTSAIEASGNGDLNIIHKSNTDHKPMHKMGYESNKKSPEQLSIERHDRTLNTKLFTKSHHTDNKNTQDNHVSYEDNPQDVKDCDPGTKIKTKSSVRSNLQVRGQPNYRLQKQEKKVQNEVPDRSVLGEGGLKRAVSNSDITNSIDCGEITTENLVKASRRDGTKVTTSSHALKHVRNSTHVSSDHAKELTEDFKRNYIQFPGNAHGKQTNTVTNNKQVGLVKQTFSDSSKHLPHTTHLEDQHPQQNRDADLLKKATATNAETIPKTNTMSRHTDPSQSDRKTQSTVPKEETACPHAAKSLFSKRLSRSGKPLHATATTEYKDILKKRWKPHNDKYLIRSNKNTTHRQKQLQKLPDNADSKEINRRGISIGNFEELCCSSEFKSHYSQEERCTENQDDINTTYSKENLSNIPHACDSSDISQESGRVSNENQTCKQIYDDQSTLHPSNQRNPKRCRDGRLFPRKCGRSIYQMKKYKTLAKTIKEPNKHLQNPNEKGCGTSDCSPTHQQTWEKTKNKPQGLNNETKSIQFNEKVASPECLQKISKRHFSKQKADMNSLSQSMMEKTNQTNGKSCCKVSTHSEHSLTFNADNINKNDPTKVKNSVKSSGTNKQPSSQTKEIDNMQETTPKLNSTSTFATNISRHWQDSNARHHCPRPRLSHPIDSATNGDGVDTGLKSGTRSKFRKPSNLQHILFKKMFKFCTGEDKKCNSEHQSDLTVGLETPQTKNTKTKALMFNDRLNTGKPKDAWVMKQLSEVLKLDNLRDINTGIDGQAGLQHLQTLVAKNCIGDESALGKVEKDYQTTDPDTQIQIQTSCEEGKAKEPDFQTCADSILGDPDECRLPDQLPGKIGGSTDVSSADISDLGSLKCDKQLVSVEDEHPAGKHGDWKSTGRINVDELREKYLREMSQKGLCRNRTFNIQNEEEKVHDEDLEDTVLTASNNRRTFSSDTTIIKSPVSLQSRNMADLSKVTGFYTSDICCNGSPNNLKQKKEDFKYKGLNAAKNSTNCDNKNFIGINCNDKCSAKDISEKQFLTGSDCEKLPKLTHNKNNKIILTSQNGVSIMPNACENIKICSLQSKSNVAIKKPSGSCKNFRLYSRINREKHDRVQMEPHRDLSEFTRMRLQLEMSNSNSPSSTSANIPVMDYSELTSQACLPYAVYRTKHTSDARVISPAKDNPFSTQENCPFHVGQQEQAYQSSTARRSQQCASRRPSQIPKMKRSETSFSRIQCSDARSFSPLLNENQKATTAKHFQSSSYKKLETISIKHQPLTETHFACQSPNETNTTLSEKGKQQNYVINARSPDSSTDVVISWFEKEIAHDTYQQDTDTELMSSLHNNPQSTVSHSPSNYTLTTICGFQGKTVPMTNSPGELMGTAEINKHRSVHKFIPQTNSNTNDRSDIKSYASREQVSDSMRRERPHWNSPGEFMGTAEENKHSSVHKFIPQTNSNTNDRSDVKSYASREQVSDSTRRERPHWNSPGEFMGTAEENKHSSVHKFIPQTNSNTNDRSDIKSCTSREQVSDSMRRERPHWNSPGEFTETAEENKHSSVHKFIPQTNSNTNDRSDIKSYTSREQVSDNMRRERPHGKDLPENISLKNSNEELLANKEDSNKLPFWQKQRQSRSNSVKIGLTADRSVFGKTSARARESKHRIGTSSQSEGHSYKVESLVKAFDNKYPAVSKEQPGTSNTHQPEGESKKPGLANIAPQSRLCTMRGLAKNRKYVNSALMYNMKKQSTNLLFKPVSENRQQLSMLKNPALSTNNSAVLDKGDLYLKYQIPTNARLYNTKPKAVNTSVERCQLQATLHKNTTAAKVYRTTNQNAIYFHSTYEPACKQMKMDVTNFDTSSGYSMQGYVHGSTDSFNRKSAAERLERERNIPPVTVPFCSQDGGANDTKHSTEYFQDVQNKKDESEDNNHEEDQRAHPEKGHTKGSACTASDSPKVSFDWYKPSATSTAPAADHDQVLLNEHQRRFVFDRRREEADNSQVGSHRQQLFVCNTPGNNGEVNYGTRLFEETRPESQESVCFGRSWNQQGFMQTNMQNSRQNMSSGSQKTICSVTMPANRRISGEETHEYKHTLARDLAEPNMDTSNDGRFQRPSHVLPINMARNAPNYFQHARMNQPGSMAWTDLHRSQPSRNCHTSDTVPPISDSRSHYTSNVPQSGPRLYNQPTNPSTQDLAEDASLSNLNALYEHLQQNYNQANAVYHSNWVLANQNNSLNNLKTIPGQFGCCTNSKINTGDTQQLLLKERNSQTYNDFTRTHFHPCHQNITSKGIFPQMRSQDDQCVQFRHSTTTNNLLVEPDLSKNRMQYCCYNQNQSFLTGSNNPCTCSSHQNMPVNVTRIFPMAPEFPAAPDIPPTWQHLHQPFNTPRNHHNIRNVHPSTLSEYVFQHNRWCSGEQSLLQPKKREDRSDSSYETARGDHNG